MELRHLRYFVVIAEELSITRAARRPRMAQPVVRNPTPAGGKDPPRHRRVRVEPLTVVLPEGHRLYGRAAVALAELAGEPFVTFPRRIASEHFDAITSHCLRAGFSPRVAAGVGVALVPAATTRPRLPGVIPRPLLDPPMTSLSLAWSAESTCSPTRSFLDLAPVVSTNGYDPGPGTESNEGHDR